MRVAQGHGSEDIWYGSDGKLFVGAAPKGCVNVSEGMRNASEEDYAYSDNSAIDIEEWLDRYVYEPAKRKGKS